MSNNNWHKQVPTPPTSYENVPFNEKQTVGSVVRSDSVKVSRDFFMDSLGGNTFPPGNDRNNVYVRIVKDKGENNGMYFYDVEIANKNANRQMGGKRRTRRNKTRRTRRHRK